MSKKEDRRLCRELPVSYSGDDHPFGIKNQNHRRQPGSYSTSGQELRVLVFRDTNENIVASCMARTRVCRRQILSSPRPVNMHGSNSSFFFYESRIYFLTSVRRAFMDAHLFKEIEETLQSGGVGAS